MYICSFFFHFIIEFQAVCHESYPFRNLSGRGWNTIFLIVLGFLRTELNCCEWCWGGVGGGGYKKGGVPAISAYALYRCLHVNKWISSKMSIWQIINLGFFLHKICEWISNLHVCSLNQLSETTPWSTLIVSRIWQYQVLYHLVNEDQNLSVSPLWSPSPLHHSVWFFQISTPSIIIGLGTLHWHDLDVPLSVI